MIYGEEWNNPDDGSSDDINVDVAISDGDGGPLSNVSLSITSLGGNGTLGNPKYRWDVVMNYATLTNETNHPDPGMGLEVGDTIGILWGGATCANDTIYGTWTVTEPGGGGEPTIPEPGTLLLLGFGLLGLAGYGICRKKRS